MTEIATQPESHLNSLQLKGLIPIYQGIIENASKSNLTYHEFLAVLFEHEVKRKKEGYINAKVSKAKFPYFKTLDQFDFSFQPSLNEKEIINLGGLSFAQNNENVIFLFITMIISESLFTIRSIIITTLKIMISCNARASKTSTASLFLRGILLE